MRLCPWTPFSQVSDSGIVLQKTFEPNNYEHEVLLSHSIAIPQSVWKT